MSSSPFQSIVNRLRRGSSGFSTAKLDDQLDVENQTLVQGFEWHVPADHKHWKRLTRELPQLKSLGIKHIWLPPGCKATHPNSNGYDIYDLYDLGEFDWKWSRPTKWGPIEDLLELSENARGHDVGLIWDAVLGHRAGGDHKERCQAVLVDEKDRRKDLSKPFEIEAWLGFDFSARNGQYSDIRYTKEHFNATDHNLLDTTPSRLEDKSRIYRIHDKSWSRYVDTSEKGNYNYLLLNNLDYTLKDVERDALEWGSWLPQRLEGVTGFRFDAARHLPRDFLLKFLAQSSLTASGARSCMIAEYWHGSLPHLRSYLRAMHYQVQVYDAPLLYNLHRASEAPRGSPAADLRKIFNGTLIASQDAKCAVTIVTSHDTQPGQTLSAPMSPSFSAIAYAIILLRQQGTPCVFYGDLYGISGDKSHPPACEGRLPDLILTRKLYAYGRQRDYFDQLDCIGWTREGIESKAHSGIAVLVNRRSGMAKKRMYAGKAHGGEEWSDLWTWDSRPGGKVIVDNDGWAVFVLEAPGLGVWVRGDAQGREQFGKFNSDIYRSID